MLDNKTQIHRILLENRNFINLFFFIFGLILTVSSIFLSQSVDAKEKSGVFGYYLFFIMYELFGTASFFIGPIYILVTLKSYFRKDLRYIQNGFLGSIFFLFSFSFLLTFFSFSYGGFVGNQLLFWGNLLIGNISAFILFFIIFVFSILKMFSLDYVKIKRILKLKKENLTNLNFGYFLGILFLLWNSKNLFKFLRKKKEETSDKEGENMEFIKKVFLSSSKKPPWIQKKIEIIEDLEKNRSVFSKETRTNEKELKDLEEEPLFYNNTLDKGFDPISKENEIPLKGMIDYEEIEVQEKIPKSFSISYDSTQSRFIIRHEDSIKKKIELNYDSQKPLLEDLNFEPSLLQLFEVSKENPNSGKLKKLLDKEAEEEFLNHEFKDTTRIDQKYDEVFQEENLDKESVNTTEEKFYQGRKDEAYYQDENNNKEIEIEENQSLEELEGSGIQDTPTPTPMKEENFSNSSLFNLNPEFYKKKLKELQEMVISSERVDSYHLPIHNIKSDGISFVSDLTIQQEIQENWQKLQKLLNDFSIKAQVVGATRGPMITMYEVRLEPGVRVNRILSLQDEIRMNLAALSIRIIAPIPGKTTIGIEVPNKNREFFRLRELIQNNSEFFSKKRDINIPLGKDVSGITRYIDLTKLPHLLIAGTTGSGKSVFLNSIIASLLYQYSPEKIRFLMIDPKMVELKLYEGIPHLLYPVIVDTKLAEKALHWAVTEMENRYKLFSLTKCRDIRSYNEKVRNKQISGNLIPYIVIFIDELADLMMISAKEVEESVIRLTQKARAVGIHLVLATQRPSVDVITALIKANCPARVSFQVAQKVDSRIILDLNGAETLLGKGDMLYKSPASTLAIRIQSPDITEEEIESIVRETQKYGFFGYIELPQEEETPLDFGFSEVDEDLIEKAWKIILETGKTSTSYIQRRLRIGYNRAANIMEKLEELGYLSAAQNNRPREILKRD
ncbi:MAG: DNA translocase FtsK [Leptonema sp. (in: bacteria)]